MNPKFLTGDITYLSLPFTNLLYSAAESYIEQQVRELKGKFTDNEYQDLIDQFIIDYIENDYKNAKECIEQRNKSELSTLFKGFEKELYPMIQRSLPDYDRQGFGMPRQYMKHNPPRVLKLTNFSLVNVSSQEIKDYTRNIIKRILFDKYLSTVSKHQHNIIAAVRNIDDEILAFKAAYIWDKQQLEEEKNSLFTYRVKSAFKALAIGIISILLLSLMMPFKTALMAQGGVFIIIFTTLTLFMGIVEFRYTVWYWIYFIICHLFFIIISITIYQLAIFPVMGTIIGLIGAGGFLYFLLSSYYFYYQHKELVKWLS